LLPPYFDHDAFTHHALHVLDAADGTLLVAIDELPTCRYYITY